MESETKVEHHDDSPRTVPSLDKFDEATRQRLEASHKLAHPLAGISQERLGVMGEEYARDSGMTSDEDIRAFRLGAMIAGNENRYDTIAELTEREREVLDREETHKWSNPSMLYWVIVSKSTHEPPNFSHGEIGERLTRGPQSVRSALPSRVWTRPSSTAHSLSTRSNSASAIQTAPETRGSSDCATRPRISAVPSSGVGSPIP